MNQLESDLKKRTFRDHAAAELKEGITHDVEGAPTIFINEKMCYGELNCKELQRAFDNLL